MIVTLGADHADIGAHWLGDRRLLSGWQAAIEGWSPLIDVTLAAIIVRIGTNVAMIGGDHRESPRDYRYVGR